MADSTTEMDKFGSKINNSSHTGKGPAWHPEPGIRGSYSLVSSCIITLVLCVWSAVHVNIPQHRRPQWRDKVNWMICAIFIPEYVVVIALRQNLVANKVRKEMSETLGIQSAIPWTKVHAFYAMMGGYALDVNAYGESFLPDSMTRVTLTPEGVKYLISHDPDLLPSLTEEDINDKSKASAFAKVLACAQATWFCLQCIGRVQQGLSISLLELNTSAHAIYALIIYCLWWKKPFEVQQPSLIAVRDDRLRAVVAHMWMSSGDSSRSGDGNPLPEFECLHYTPVSQSCPLDIIITTPIAVVPLASASRDPGSLSEQIQQRTGFSLRSDSGRFRKKKPARTKRQRLEIVKTGWIGLPRSIQFDQSTFTRWQLASRAIREYGLPPPDAVDKNLLVVKAQTSPQRKDLSFDEWPFNIPVALFYGIYGGVHALAWNYPFISPREQFFWRAAALVLMSPAVFVPVLFGYGYIYINTEKFWAYAGTFNGFSKLVLRLGLIVVFLIMAGSVGGIGALIVGPLGYPVARFYVIILSIKDLFFLEPKVFQQPVWTRYIPHIA